MQYDDRSNTTAVEWYGLDGQRCLTKDGYAKTTAGYDDTGHPFEQVEFDLAGRSTVKKLGQRGEEIEEAYFDETSKPVTNKNGVARWSAKHEGAKSPPR